jgi:hypothetical protein
MLLDLALGALFVLSALISGVALTTGPPCRWGGYRHRHD